MIDHFGNHLYHPVSTARMGKNSSDSVVDANLKIHGLENIRIIDASVFPHIVSGNTNAACMMVGEKGADIIKKEHKI